MHHDAAAAVSMYHADKNQAAAAGNMIVYQGAIFDVHRSFQTVVSGGTGSLEIQPVAE
jgi:hypothetical protein